MQDGFQFSLKHSRTVLNRTLRTPFLTLSNALLFYRTHPPTHPHSHIHALSLSISHIRTQSHNFLIDERSIKIWRSLIATQSSALEGGNWGKRPQTNSIHPCRLLATIDSSMGFLKPRVLMSPKGNCSANLQVWKDLVKTRPAYSERHSTCTNADLSGDLIGCLWLRKSKNTRETSSNIIFASIVGSLYFFIAILLLLIPLYGRILRLLSKVLEVGNMHFPKVNEDAGENIE